MQGAVTREREMKLCDVSAVTLWSRRMWAEAVFVTMSCASTCALQC